MKMGKGLLFALILIVALSLGSIWLKNEQAQSGGTARIYQNGELIKEIDLTAVGASYSFVVEGKNTISVKEGYICISHATCPDQICVKQGWISDGTVPIVCLPNKVVIEIVGGGDAFDAATG